MILNDNAYEIESSLTNSKKFTIKASPKAFKILSNNLYSNKIKAIIRELSCNAYDSHKAAGNDEPFIIHLPDDINNHFYIRDYGTGLCEKDILNLYTTYFDSNKTGSNDYVGALGLGSKSPFSYTDSFVVESYFNNIKYTYLIYIDEDDTPAISKLSKEPTEEKNGLMIKFSVKKEDMNSFRHEAYAVLSVFENRPDVFYNNEKLNLGEKLKFTKDGYSLGNFGSYWESLYAFMGNILYPISYDKLNLSENMKKFIQSQNMYIKFQIGELDITPSREHLSYNKQTCEKLCKKITETCNRIIEVNVNTLNAMNNTVDMILAFNDLPNHLRPVVYERLDFDKFSKNIQQIYNEDVNKFYLSTKDINCECISENIKSIKICKLYYKYNDFAYLTKIESNIFDIIKKKMFYISFSNKEDYMYKYNNINGCLISVRMYKRSENDKKRVINDIMKNLYIDEIERANKLQYVPREKLEEETIKYKNDMAVCYDRNICELEKIIKGNNVSCSFNYDSLHHFETVFPDDEIKDNGNIFILPVSKCGVLNNKNEVMSDDDKKFYTFCMKVYKDLYKNKRYHFKIIICRNKAIDFMKKYNFPHFCYFISRVLKKNTNLKSNLMNLYSIKSSSGNDTTLIRSLSYFKNAEKILDKNLLRKINNNLCDNNVLDYFSKEYLERLYRIKVTDYNDESLEKYRKFFKMINECTWGSYLWKKHEDCFVEILNLIYMKENNNEK